MTTAEKLTQIAENQQRVYDAGFTAGQAQGGADSYYDTFWDAYQQNGSTTGVSYMFAGLGWTDETFKPKYSLARAYTANYMFAGTGITDISHLPRMTVRYGIGHMFFNSTAIAHVGEIYVDSTSLTLTSMFQGATALHTIDKLTVQSGNNYTNAFSNCTSLANITFDGVIGNAISFANSSLLTDASVQSIIDHLEDLTGKTAQKLTLHATVGGKLTQEQKDAVSAKNWTLAY